MKNRMRFFTLLMLLLNSFGLTAQIAINTGGSVANSSAMLDVSSTDKGLLIPRMSTTQRGAIASPATGLVVFDTDLGEFYYYNGSSWTKVNKPDSGWTLTSESLYPDSLIKVGVGTSTPSATFQVATLYHAGTYGADLCLGGTPDASDYYGPGYESDKAFDDDVVTHWDNDNVLPSWLEYSMGSGYNYRVAKYRIYFSNPSSDYSHSPDEWTFEASDDGSSWTILDTQTGQGWTSDAWKEFTFSNITKYSYYRLNISDNKGATDSYISIYELELMEEDISNHNTLFVNDNKVGIGTSSPAQTLDVNGTFKLVDGNEDDGRVLASDASGNASWTDGTSLNGGGWVIGSSGIYTEQDGVAVGTSTMDTSSLIAVSNTAKQTALNIETSSGNSDDISAIESQVSGTGSGIQYGYKQTVSCSGDGDHYGGWFTLSGSGTGNKYGLYVNNPSSAGGTHYGIYSESTGTTNYAGYFHGNFYVSGLTGFGTTSPDAILDISNSLSNKSLKITNTKTGTVDKYGIYSEIISSTSGSVYGNYSKIDVSGNGAHYGSYNEIDSDGNSSHFGVFNTLGGAGTGSQYCVNNSISATGDGTHYGVYNSLTGSGSGDKFGSFSMISSYGSGTHYGYSISDRGFGSGDVYGDYIYLGTSTSGTHYGVYSDVSGASNFAGYFIGNLVMESGYYLGAGTTTPLYTLQVGESGDGSSAIANSWLTFSDRRWKKDIVTIDSPIEKLSKINGYYYHWKNGVDTSLQIGVIAQEMEKVLPEVVSTDKKGYKSVDYAKITALLIEVNKQQQKEIEALRRSVDKQSIIIEKMLKSSSQKE